MSQFQERLAKFKAKDGGGEASPPTNNPFAAKPQATPTQAGNPFETAATQAPAQAAPAQAGNPFAAESVNPFTAGEPVEQRGQIWTSWRQQGAGVAGVVNPPEHAKGPPPEVVEERPAAAPAAPAKERVKKPPTKKEKDELEMEYYRAVIAIAKQMGAIQ